MSGDGYLLSWDAGSGGWRAVVVDTQGRLVDLGLREGRVVRAPNLPASLEFDPEEMWATFGELTRQALCSVPPEEILAMSTTSFRDGVVFLDRDGRVLYAGTNRDARSVAQGFEMAQRHGETIYALTGR